MSHVFWKQNLRESINNPKKLMSEAFSKTNKRKKRHKSLGSLIKKSCKRLEMFEAESNITAEDRILKKLKKMNDLIQIPVGNKLVTGKKNLVVSSKNKKPKKSDLGEQQTWIITENVEKPNTVDAQSKSDWTVSECEYETKCPSILADNSQDLELALSSSTSEEQLCIVSSTGKRRSAETTSNLSSPIKSVGIEISNDDSTEINSKRKKLSIEESEFDRISSTSIKHALRSSPQKLVTSLTSSSEIAGNEKLDKLLENLPSPRCQRSLKKLESDKTIEDVPIPTIENTKLSTVSSSPSNTAKKVSKKLFCF